MIHLQEILYKVSIRAVQGDTSIAISDAQTNSAKVGPGALFIAVKGTHADGHQYIDQAIGRGAVAVVCEEMPASPDNTVVYVQVENSAAAAGYIAHNFYGQPSEKLQLIGVTGTNGKTTVATLLFKLFSALGYKCGLISTVQNQIGELVVEATHTTPDPISLSRLMNQMVQAGCSHAFMEVSSHAIHQYRIAGLRFAGGIFTNISHDHLDYHKTFDEYIWVKKQFFDYLPSGAFAISNADDKRGAVMLQNTHAKKSLYSLKTGADFTGRIRENSLTGLVMLIDDQEVHFRMIGEFNAYNLLAVYGAAVCCGEDKHEILRCLSILTGAEGRFDYSISAREKVIGIVDYAHTPDALLNVLKTIKKLRRGHEQIITVVGCGGDRDKTKRPVMGEVACEHSDKVIFTSDNPRNEDPSAIIKDMEQGLNSAARRKYVAVENRKEAIKTAVHMAHPEDILLIAGKGHEKYQETRGVRLHFDDKEVMMEMFETLGK